MSNSKTGVDRPFERRQLTILECDLVGSTTLASRMDQEDYASLVITFRERVTRLMRSYGGFIFQYVGDAVWVYFGYPHAQEDAVHRAIRASLAVIDELSKHEGNGNRVQCRICIGTGVCVIGDIRFGFGDSNVDAIAGQDSGIVSFGDSLNLVARLKSVADPETVVVADETHTLAGNAYQFLDLQSHTLKGLDGPVRAWQVLGETPERSRFKKLRLAPSACLIGRDAELAVLNECWKQANSGHRQIVDIVGDPGIGKSRLVTVAVDETLKEVSELTWWFHCSPDRTNSAFSPIIDHLLMAANIYDDDSSNDVFKKIGDRFPNLDDDAIALLVPLLPIESVANAVRKCSLSPTRRRELVLDVLVDLVEAACADNPLLIVAEDVHWSDPSTDEFLRLLVRKSKGLRLLLLNTSRLSRNSGDGHGGYFNLQLGPLTTESSLALIRSLLAFGNMPDELSGKIADSTDGVPLFIEDVTHSVIQLLTGRESKAADLLESDADIVSVPVALRDHLMARIDQLGDAKSTAQAAAVIGRKFSRAMVKCIVSVDSDSLDNHLVEMLDSGLVQRSLEPGLDSFSFKHALVRDAAYESLLKSDRVILHGNLACWIELEQPEFAASRPEITAGHHELAGNLLPAITGWLEAGRRSLQRVGYLEAISQLERAYGLLVGIDQSQARDRTELDIITALGAAHAGAGAFSSESTGQAYERALQLCTALGNPPETLSVLSGACAFHFMRADYDRARDLSTQCMRHVDDDGIPKGAVVGHRALGAICLVTGQFNDSIENLQTAIELYERDPAVYRGLPAANALDHKTTALCFLALAKLAVGCLDSAEVASERALKHSKKIDLHSVNYSLCYRSALLHLRGDEADVVYKVAKESLHLAMTEGYATWVGISRLCLGEAMIRLGDIDAGISEIEQGVTEHANALAVTFLPFAQSVLAKGYLLANRAEDADELLNEALRVSAETRQMWLFPEFKRLQAKSLELQGSIEQAETGFLVASEMASKAGAQFWKLKAELSLAELLYRSDRSDEALELISTFQNALPEGRHSPIVRSVRALSNVILSDQPSEVRQSLLIRSTED